jgi:carotenoid 1,2-hydratase
VARNGYVWWYVDALSDDGLHGLTIIAFIGSVFSPYYARARRHGGDVGADPLNHCALNVSLYGVGDKHWTMTERKRNAVTRDNTMLQIGPSALNWTDGVLTIDIDEVTVPWPSKVRGKIVLRTPPLVRHTFSLDESGCHRWRPLAPSARIDVQLDQPIRHWQGAAYFDSNAGDAPIEDAFAGWQWSRASLPGGDTVVLYDAVRRSGDTLVLGNQFDSRGRMTPFALPPRELLPATSWRLVRSTFSEAGTAPAVIRTVEDGPFYARSIIAARLGEQQVTAFHETLSLERFRSRWVQMLLPFRMPRR